MSFVVLLEDGAEVVTTYAPAWDFEPRTATTPGLEVGRFWEAVPSDLHELPTQERAFVQTVWRCLLQYYGDLFSQALHSDAIKSLTDFPIHAERRWLQFELTRVFAIEDPGADVVVDNPDTPLTDTGEYLDDQGKHRMQMTLHGGAALGRILIPLRSALTSQASLRFALRTEVAWDLRSNPDQEAWVLVGWSNYEHPHSVRGSGLWAAISSQGRLALVIVASAADLRGDLEADRIQVFVSAQALPSAAQNIELSLWWDAAPAVSGGSRFVLTVYDTVQDASVSLSGNTRLSIVDNLQSDFTADSFGFSAPWRTLIQASSGALLEGDYLVTLRPASLVFADPSVHRSIRYIPCLQPYVTTSQGILRAGVEFDLQRASDASWGYLRFASQPPDVLWAESSSLDMELLHRIFGPLTGILDVLDTPDTYELRTQIVGALYGLLCGPHLSALSVAMGGVLGAPMALDAGEVTRVFTLGGNPAIEVRNILGAKVYPYDAGLTRLVEVGDRVEKFQPLVRMAEVHDWKSAPQLLASVVDHEIQKYASVLVQIPAEFLTILLLRLDDPSPGEISALVSRFVKKVGTYTGLCVGVWCGVANAFLQLLAQLDDDLLVDDDLTFSGRRDLYLGVVNALPGAPAGTPEWDADPVQPGDLRDLLLLRILWDAFDRDGKPGFAYTPIEWDPVTMPRRRSALLLREALNNADDPRYNDSHPPRQYATGPTSRLPLDGRLRYNQAGIWVLDTRLSFTVSYDGPDAGPMVVDIFDAPQTMTLGQQETFEEPDYWDETH